MQQHQALHDSAGGRAAQVKLTLMLAGVAVPINTLFGITAALVIARNEFVGKTWVMTLLDLPFSISPVITGMVVVMCLRTLCSHGMLESTNPRSMQLLCLHTSSDPLS